MNSVKTFLSKPSGSSIDNQSDDINDQKPTINASISPVHNTIEKLEEELAKMSEYIKVLEQKSDLWNKEILSMKEKLNKHQELSRNLESEFQKELSEARQALNQNSSLNQKKSMQDKEIRLIKEHLELQRALTIESETRNKLLEEKLHEARIALDHKDTIQNKKLREELSEARQALDVHEQIKKRKRIKLKSSMSNIINRGLDYRIVVIIFLLCGSYLYTSYADKGKTVDLGKEILEVKSAIIKVFNKKDELLSGAREHLKECVSLVEKRETFPNEKDKFDKEISKAEITISELNNDLFMSNWRKKSLNLKMSKMIETVGLKISKSKELSN